MCGWRLAMMLEMCGPSCPARVHAVGAAAAVEASRRKGRPALTISNAAVHQCCSALPKHPSDMGSQQCPLRQFELRLLPGGVRAARAAAGAAAASVLTVRWYQVPGLARAAGPWERRAAGATNSLSAHQCTTKSKAGKKGGVVSTRQCAHRRPSG
jgi:hypothetical protein